MSSPLSFLSPVDSVNGGFLSFSPSAETTYSSDDETTPETPFTEHAERDGFPDHHFNYEQNLFRSPDSQLDEAQSPAKFDWKNMNELYFSGPTIPQLCTPPSNEDSFLSSQSYPSLSPLVPPSTAEDTRNTLDKEVDPFDAAFAIVNDERVKNAPLLVQTSFAEAARYSSRFPAGHLLHPTFVRTYDLGDELGSGGYGFVMTAYHRAKGHEVAVKFIIKRKISVHAWMEDEAFGRLPTEVMLLSLIDHPNIVKCLDLFEDRFCFYLVQELHGSPWPKKQFAQTEEPRLIAISELPVLSPSASADSMPDLDPLTPHRSSQDLVSHVSNENTMYYSSDLDTTSQDQDQQDQLYSTRDSPNQLLRPPQFTRRPSHDLFECIEQIPEKRFSEDQASYIFAQVVEAAYYLDCQGITHRDIKDENLVIDKNLNVKLIDFGSAVIADPSEPRPFYTLFFGTVAYASSEILLKEPYQAPPAEVWTLGVLLSYILTGMSPFPTQQDAIEGRIVLAEIEGVQLSRACLHLMRRCLEPYPEMRADIREVREHRWLRRGGH